MISVLATDLIESLGVVNITPLSQSGGYRESDSPLTKLADTWTRESTSITKTDSARRFLRRLRGGEMATVSAHRADELLASVGRDAYALAHMIHVPTSWASAHEMAKTYIEENPSKHFGSTKELADALFNFARGLMLEEEMAISEALDGA